MTDYQKKSNQISGKLDGVRHSQEVLIRSILKYNNQQVNGDFGEISYDNTDFQVLSVYIDFDTIFVEEDEDPDIPPVACSLYCKGTRGQILSR